MNPSKPPTVKCLLVDDREENLLALSALLKRDDVELLEARSGPEALELLLIHDVALAFLDVQMPEMDGFELAELMRGAERTRHVPLIFITAGPRDQHRVFKGYEAGAVDFLYKPIEPHILKNKADVFFQLYRQKQQLAQELRERTETLRLNEMFTAVLGHDLRNPLGAILLSAELLERRAENEAARAAASRMRSSAKSMSRMIDDMLDLARARLAGGIPLKCAQADLGAVIDGVVHECEAAMPDRHIDVRKRGDLTGYWDADRMAQAASNLIINSLKHGTAGGKVEVDLDGTHTDAVTLCVGNAGCIPSDALPHLFDPFYRGRREAQRDGLGLGLYIVQQIVQAHGGSVVVSTDVIDRTVFKVAVPREATRNGDGCNG
jgi:two-component system, sensor histidine kinase and response regulator